MKLKLACSIAGLLTATALIGTPSAFAQELNFWTLTFSSDAANKAITSIAKEFEAKHPGTQVIVTQRGTDDHKKALRISAGSDKGPDIFFSWAGLGLGGDYVNAGMSLPLDKYYKQYNWNETLLPSAAAFADDYAGGLHGVPFTFKGEAIYYNKALFAKAGIKNEPSTYDELVADAEALKKAGIPAFTFGGSVNWHIMRLMDEILEAKCGADGHDELMSLKADWSKSACALTSFTEMKKWADNYFLKPFMGIDNNQSFNLFVANRAAMVLEGSWTVNKITEVGRADDMGVFVFPTGTDRLYGFAEYNYISSNSKHPDLAAAFLDYFNSTDVQQRYLGRFANNSINAKVEYGQQSPLNVEWDGFFAKYSKMFVNGDQAFPAKIIPEYWRVINAVSSDDMTPQEAVDALQTFIGNNR
nr:extracellular solute-binding protein [uncultured Cohaesibacter sp.]